MIYAGDFRKGITFEIDGDPHVVIDFQHVKPGKGAAFVRTKHKNILTGAIKEESFNPDAKFPKAHIETKTMQYLYSDGELYYFMDPETYDQIPLAQDQVEEAMKYLRENDEATIKFYKGNAFLVEAPNFVDLLVTETEPGVKGDTATNVTKDATVETGAVVKVPIFIEEGERIQIDTKEGEVNDALYSTCVRTILVLLAPFVPHITEELWQELGYEGYVYDQKWPTWNEEELKKDEIEIVVQINGKNKEKINIPGESTREDMLKIAEENEIIKGLTEGKNVVKVIAVPGRLINIVVKG